MSEIRRHVASGTRPEISSSLVLSFDRFPRFQQHGLEVRPVLPVGVVLPVLAIAFGAVPKDRLGLVKPFARRVGLLEAMIAHSHRGPVKKPFGDRSGFVEALPSLLELASTIVGHAENKGSPVGALGLVG